MTQQFRQHIHKTFNERMNTLAQATFNTKKDKRLEGIAKAQEAAKRRNK